MSVLVPSYHWLDKKGKINIARSSDGHFYIKARVNNITMINFLIDTGASDIALTKQDAAKLGFNSSNLIFSKTYLTANGSSSGAPITLKVLSIGNTELNNVKAHVLGGDSDDSLFGVSAINRFKVFSINGDILTIGF